MWFRHYSYEFRNCIAWYREKLVLIQVYQSTIPSMSKYFDSNFQARQPGPTKGWVGDGEGSGWYLHSNIYLLCLFFNL